jgi:hypothetical protein
MKQFYPDARLLLCADHHRCLVCSSKLLGFHRPERYPHLRSLFKLASASDTLSANNKRTMTPAWLRDLAQVAVGPAECSTRSRERVTGEAWHGAPRQPSGGSCAFGCFSTGAFAGFANFTFLGGAFCGFPDGAFFFCFPLSPAFGFKARGFFGGTTSAFDPPQ